MEKYNKKQLLYCLLLLIWGGNNMTKEELLNKIKENDIENEELKKLIEYLENSDDLISNEWVWFILIILFSTFLNKPNKITNIYLGDD